MLLLIRRHFWILGVGVAAICALLAHSGWEQLAAAGHVDLPDESLPEPVASPPAIPRSSKDGEELSRRNIFCSTCSPARDHAEGERSGDRVPLTTLPLDLLATSLAGVPDDSFATVRHAGSGQQGAYWIGESLPGAGAIESVGGSSVVFRNPATQHLERLSLLADAAPRSAPGRKSTTAGASTSAPYADRVLSAGENRYAVDASLVAELIANPMAIKGVRFLPQMADGKVAGFKLQHARRNSIATAMGLRRGDLVQSINGNQLRDVDALLGIYTRLRDQSSFEVTIERKGKPVTLRYDVR